MRVLLTGAAGFVGKGLLVELLKSPTVELVLCLSRSAVRSAATPEDGRVRWIHGDLKNTGWHDLVGRVDVVIHTALPKRHLENRLSNRCGPGLPFLSAG